VIDIRGRLITYHVATLSYDNDYVDLEIILTPYYVIYYNVMVNIFLYYSNTTIVNMYLLYRKLV
jgi:hypothetical protein